ncbi:hypothetical protein [Brachyspira hampsonii]|uniref:Lipoprotein n=2 Tax=Brachyspira hampsonii TaxID=1287055 RepID=A0AAC9XLJ6_9SPIR|nr:hypothetical protein [Brachyspira hampsonii]ASJ22393.1 hypothetical protein BHAMNSH16_12370 [Brachyspira hampsonii]ELV04977.1 hypothetical protein H263_12879 [Brachyspira hampsonii 30599]OEJ18255.1 hypothetical protein A9496_08625 [Brachyspira hampsonii]
MKKLLLTSMMLLSLFAVGCGDRVTAPQTNDNNSHSQSFTGNFTFGTFGNASGLSINEDGSIYMNMDNVLLTIKKEMVTKISDSQYAIKGQMPTIKYDTSSAVTKSVMFAQSASDMNTVDVSLNLSGGSLSLSGTINDNSVSGNLKEVSGYIPSSYTGTYYHAYNESASEEVEIKANGYFSMKAIQDGIVAFEQEYTDKLIKVSENEYILNNSAKMDIPATGTISDSEAESVITLEAMKYYNISMKSTLKFENNIMTRTANYLRVTHQDTEEYKKYIQEVAKDRSYTNEINYSLFTLELENTTLNIYTKK